MDENERWYNEKFRQQRPWRGYDDENEQEEALPPTPMPLEAEQQSPQMLYKWRSTKATYVGGRRKEWVSELLGIVEASTQQEASRIAREKFGVSIHDDATLWVERLVNP